MAPIISREGAVRSGVSSPMDPRGSRNVTNQGVDTPPSSSSSGIRETISPSPNTPDFIAKDTIDNDLPPTPVLVNGIITNKGLSNGLPPGVPTGPAAYRNRQSPPLNAPKGPASQRRRVPLPSVAGPGQQQRLPTSYPVSYSNSMTWKSTDVQKRETLEKMARSHRHTNTDNLFEVRRRFLEWKVVYEKDRINRLENEKKDRAERETNQGNQGEHAYHPLLFNMNTIWGDSDVAPSPAKGWPESDCRHLPVNPSYSQIQADQDPFPEVSQLNTGNAALNASIDENEHRKENLPPMPSGNTHCPLGVCMGAWSDPYNVLKIMELLELDIPNMENMKDVRSQDNDDITKLISEINETNLDDIELN
ncbi:hypothetical protein CSOJ01_03792 [Colletotrichum sojae]|uniref:Uncharacterized protein n=1 Tax=Colletotrichum sojae TaxID=2175907 RepID=A0A8H6JKS5_9PEZI|nr:hypothetical protein CSOJ01_03792 [Colletotrichum sojae]